MTKQLICIAVYVVALCILAAHLIVTEAYVPLLAMMVLAINPVAWASPKGRDRMWRL